MIVTRLSRPARLAVVAAGAVLASAATGAQARTGTAPDPHLSLRPICGFPEPFTFFQPGTDSATVTRTRGTPPTSLVVHAGHGGMTLANMHLDVMSWPAVVQAHVVPTTTAQGQAIAVEVGDTADDGTPLAPGRYEVYGSADVSGRNHCGRTGPVRIGTRVGFLLVV